MELILFFGCKILIHDFMYSVHYNHLFYNLSQGKFLRID